MGERYLKSVRLPAAFLVRPTAAGESLFHNGNLEKTVASGRNAVGEAQLYEQYSEHRSSAVQRAAGFSTFPNVFPAVVAHGKQLFADDGDGDFEQLDHALHRLRTRLDAPGLSTQGGHIPADEGSYEDSTARR